MPSDSGDTRAIRVQATMSAYPPPKLADPLPCPRCNSTVTKFCYYNNYNLSQPRHFCKSCRRYWTHGGTLRNIPVGGGTRKNSTSSAPKRHRSSSSVSASSSSSSLTVTQEPEPVPTPVPNTDSVGLVPVQAGTGPIEPKTVGVSESNGSFASLLTGHGDGSFLALGGSGSGSGFGFEYSYGFGCGFDEIGLDIGGYHGSGAGMAGNVNGSETDTWNQMSGAQEDSSGGVESLVWPGLEISMPSKNVN